MPELRPPNTLGSAIYPTHLVPPFSLTNDSGSCGSDFCFRPGPPPAEEESAGARLGPSRYRQVGADRPPDSHSTTVLYSAVHRVRYSAVGEGCCWTPQAFLTYTNDRLISWGTTGYPPIASKFNPCFPNRFRNVCGLQVLLQSNVGTRWYVDSW